MQSVIPDPDRPGVIYNIVAGQNIDRLGGYCDGVIGVAMTLLGFGLTVPALETIHTEKELITALSMIAPKLLVYVMSFMTLGIFWIGQQTQMNQLARADRNLTWLHLTFLFFVTLVPFTTALVATFIAFRTAILIYWLNIFCLGAMLLIAWRYAVSAKLVSDGARPGLSAAIERRIVVAQGLYAVSAALCVLSPYLSVALIIAIQVIYVIGPRSGLLSRL